MEIRIARNEFLKGLQSVQGIVDTRSTMPILSNILLETQEQGISITATDLEIGLKGFCEARVIQKGKVTINAKKIHDIVRELPEQDIHMNDEKENWVKISCGNSHFNLAGFPPEDFPSLPAYSEEGMIGLSGTEIKEMIEKTIYAVSTDENRQALNGVLFRLSANRNQMIATDGHRLALITGKKIGGAEEEKNVIIPRKVLSEIVKTIDEEEPLFFSVTDNHLVFKQTKRILISKMIDAKFPNFEQVIPRENQIKLKISRQELIHTLRRVSVLTSDRSKMIKFVIGDNKMILESEESEVGNAKEEIGYEGSAEKLVIGLNARYLLDVLNAFDQEEVGIELKDSLGPALFVPFGEDTYKCVIMPMRIEETK
jgi:DNA polymerase-3 subunit beta